MKLTVRPVTIADFEIIRSIYGPITGDLSAPALGATWHVGSDDMSSAQKRIEWSCQQQIDIINNDPTTRMVKAVDTDNNDEILALGRWHRYPSGYEPVADLEIAGLKDRNDPMTWPMGLSKDFYVELLDSILRARNTWMEPGHCWILTTLVTREPCRRQGAGSSILEWGLQEAAKEGVPAYIEAAAAAKGLYERHGFRQVDENSVDLTPFGFPGAAFTVAYMRADPK